MESSLQDLTNSGETTYKENIFVLMSYTRQYLRQLGMGDAVSRMMYDVGCTDNYEDAVEVLHSYCPHITQSGYEVKL